MGFYGNIINTNNYKTIKVENSDSVAEAAQTVAAKGQSADSTQDTVNFNASNKWIKVDNNTEDTIKFGHALSPAIANQQFGLAADVDITDLGIDNTFEVPNFTLDEAGHVINAQTHTITISESFTKINAAIQNEENRATEAEQAIQAAIPEIPSKPTTAGYYILHVLDDGTAKWILFNYTSPVVEEYTI